MGVGQHLGVAGFYDPRKKDNVFVTRRDHRFPLDVDAQVCLSKCKAANVVDTQNENEMKRRGKKVVALCGPSCICEHKKVVGNPCERKDMLQGGIPSQKKHAKLE